MRALFAFAALMLMVSAPARAEPPKLAVFDFELLDTSLEGEMRGPQADEHDRLMRISDQVRRQLAESGKFQLLDIAPVKAAAARQQSAGLRRLRRPVCAADRRRSRHHGRDEEDLDLDSQPDHLRARRPYRTAHHGDECRFSRQHRRILDAGDELSRAQPVAGAELWQAAAHELRTIQAFRRAACQRR